MICRRLPIRGDGNGTFYRSTLQSAFLSGTFVKAKVDDLQNLHLLLFPHLISICALRCHAVLLFACSA